MIIPTLYIFGDSHVLSYGITKKYELFNVIENHFTGSSITGLNNFYSTLNAGKKIREIMKNIKKNDIVLFQFGQVDIEYIYHYKLWVKNENIDITTFIEDLVNKYMIFITSLDIINKCVVVVSSIHLPNCNNNDLYLKKYIRNVITYPQVINNSDVIINESTYNSTLVTCKLVTEYSNHMNYCLKNICGDHKILFLDTTLSFIGEDGLLNYKYVSDDHHYKGYQDYESCIKIKHVLLQNLLKINGLYLV